MVWGLLRLKPSITGGFGAAVRVVWAGAGAGCGVAEAAGSGEPNNLPVTASYRLPLISRILAAEPTYVHPQNFLVLTLILRLWNCFRK